MGIVLYITPGDWGLPSINPSCLAALIFLQLTIPGQFTISECSNPDDSPTGQLPYLTHDRHVVVLLSSIIKYVSSLDKRNTGEYQGLNKSQNIAWSAHAEAELGDLVYYMLYSVPSNWNLTYQALASMFPGPQRYFVPARIRDMHRPRLEAAGLWSVPEVEKESKKPFQPISQAVKAKKTNTFLRAFEKEKAIEKAKPILDLYSRLLKEAYFGSDRPSALDAIVAAHIILLLEPPYPAPVIKDILLDDYPSLVIHSRLVFSHTSAATIPRVAAQTIAWRDILPSLPWSRKTHKKTEEEIRYHRSRWCFFGLVVGCMATYLAVVSRNVKIRIADVDGEENESEERESEREEEEEDR